MEFVLIYPNRRPFCDPDITASAAQAAEEAGFYAVLSWDHYTLPHTKDWPPFEKRTWSCPTAGFAAPLAQSNCQSGCTCNPLFALVK
ncbi:MAG: hypothetical protein HY683_09065 [Chloroflexi bacterium]|nr:hypothetical protein [Chloroflexota bacterium]